MSQLEDSLILVRNVEWIMELYQAEQILSMEVKNLMVKIEETFR